MTLAHLIPRVMFAWRITGTVFKPMTLSILEGVIFFIWLVWRGLIMRTLTLPSFLIYALSVVICSLIYVIDTERNVYDIADDEDYM